MNGPRTLEWQHLSLGQNQFLQKFQIIISFFLIFFINLSILGPSCIRLNQSTLRPQKQQEIQIKDVHKDISTKVQNHLVEYHHISRTQPIFREYSDQLLHHPDQCYFIPLPHRDYIQAKEQAQIVASIRKKIKQNNLIICLTNKSNHFYINSSEEFEKKVQKYFTDTNAFTELSH